MLWLRLIYIGISKGKNLSIFCNSGNDFRMSPGNYILEKKMMKHALKKQIVGSVLVFSQEIRLKNKSLVLKYIQRFH